MARVVIEGIPAYAGNHELDTDHSWNAREWGWIKRLSGYLPLTISEGFAGNDPELWVALAVIALVRNGRIERDDWERVADEMREARGMKITLTDDGYKEDEVPLDLMSPPAEPSRNDSPSNDESKKESESSSGPTSNPPSAPQDVTPPPTTLLRLGTSSV